MTIIEIEHSANVITVLGGAVGALATIWLVARKIYKTIDNKVLIPMHKGLDKVSKNYTSMEQALPILVGMSKEFTPNCGSSLRDCINRIENNIDNLRATDHLLLDMSDIGHFETDGNGDCIWANKKYEEITGLTLLDLLGKGWVNCIHPEDREAVTAEWYAAVHDRRPFIYLFRYLRPNGEIKSVRVQAVINYNSKNVCIGALGSVFEAR